jgi:hypothetical protein
VNLGKQPIVILLQLTVVQNPLLAVNDGPITVATATVSKVVLNVTTNDTFTEIQLQMHNTNVTKQQDH